MYYFNSNNTFIASYTNQTNSTFLLCYPCIPSFNNDNFTNFGTTCNCSSTSNVISLFMIERSNNLPNSIFQTCKWNFTQDPSPNTLYSLSIVGNDYYLEINAPVSGFSPLQSSFLCRWSTKLTYLKPIILLHTIFCVT